MLLPAVLRNRKPTSDVLGDTIQEPGGITNAPRMGGQAFAGAPNTPFNPNAVSMPKPTDFRTRTPGKGSGQLQNLTDQFRAGGGFARMYDRGPGSAPTAQGQYLDAFQPAVIAGTPMNAAPMAGAPPKWDGRGEPADIGPYSPFGFRNLARMISSRGTKPYGFVPGGDSMGSRVMDPPGGLIPQSGNQASEMPMQYYRNGNPNSAQPSTPFDFGGSMWGRGPGATAGDTNSLAGLLRQIPEQNPAQRVDTFGDVYGRLLRQPQPNPEPYYPIGNEFSPRGFASGGKVGEMMDSGPYAIPSSAGKSRPIDTGPTDIQNTGGVMTPTGFVPTVTPQLIQEQIARQEAAAPSSLTNPIVPRLGSGRRQMLTFEGRDTVAGSFPMNNVRRRSANVRAFADGGRAYSASTAAASMGTNPPNMFTEDEENEYKAEEGCAPKKAVAGYADGGRVTRHTMNDPANGYADGGRVNANNYISTLLNGRNPFGRIGANIQNVLADNAQAQYRGFDPRLIQAGFAVRPDTMAENANTFITNWTNPNWQDGMHMIDGVGHVQFGDFVRQLEGGGQGINQDDLMKYVRDPSKVIYDEEAGLITPRDNFTFQPEDGLVTKFMHSAIPAIAMAAAGAGVNNAFFGGPDLTSILGSGPGAPTGADGATGSFDTGGWTGTGIDGNTGVSPGGFGAGGAGGAGDAAGTFDQTGWQGTNINGNTGVSNGNWLTRTGDFLSNPANRQAIQTIARLGVGALSGKGDQQTDVAPYQPGTGVGTTGTGGTYIPPAGKEVAPPEYKDLADYLGPQAGGSTQFGMSGMGNISISSGVEDQYKPLEEQLLKDLQERSDPTYAERKANQAIGDVANTFAAQRGALQRDASRRGVGYSPDRMQAMGVSEAANRALAANLARDRAEQEQINTIAPIVGRERDRAASTAAAAAAGYGTAQAAQFRAQADADTRAQQLAYNRMIDDRNRQDRRYEFDTTNNRLGERDARTDFEADRRYGLDTERLNRGIYESDRNYTAGQDAAANASRQRNLAAVGTLLGNSDKIINGIKTVGGWLGFEDGGRVIDGHSQRVVDTDDGGRVHGPGTETSDSIPAKISKGEMVINADSVKALDEKAPGLLDRINDIGLKMRAIRGGTNTIKTIGVRG